MQPVPAGTRLWLPGSFLLPRAKPALSTSPSPFSPEDEGPDLLVWSKWAQSQLCAVEYSRGQWKGTWSERTVLDMVDPYVLLDFPVDLEANIHLTWVRVSAFFCLSSSFLQFSDSFPSFPCLFLKFLHLSSSSFHLFQALLVSYIILLLTLLCKTTSIHILPISQSA